MPAIQAELSAATLLGGAMEMPRQAYGADVVLVGPCDVQLGHL